MRSHLSILACFFFILVSLNSSAKVTVAPFFELPSGQMVLKLKLSGIETEQLFIFEISGTSNLRRDMDYRLHALGIDTTQIGVQFDTISIEGHPLIENNKFQIRKKLEKRSKLVFPDAILGTIGPMVFKDKVIAINYQKHSFTLADNINELTIPDSTKQISFSNSIINYSPTLEFEIWDFGKQLIGLDFSLPVNLNLHWSLVDGKAKYWSDTEFGFIKTSFDGEKELILRHYKFEEIYLNREISLYNIEATFSDKVLACFGRSFLSQVKTIIDFNNGQIYFTPISNVARNIFYPPK